MKSLIIPALGRRLAASLLALACLSLVAYAQTAPQYLGGLSTNPYAADSTSNTYGRYGSHSSTSIKNQYGRYGSPYSPNSAANPYAVNTTRIHASDGTYLGKLSSNPYDPQSTPNPYGRYGSPYSPTSINNSYGPYGSPYSPTSARNPFAVAAPIILSGGPR